MKKSTIYLLLIFVIINWQSKAQFSENFDSGVPGSMIQTYITNTVDWSSCGGGTGPTICPYNGAGSAHFFENQDTGSQTALVTPILDLSSGAYLLKFSHVQPEWSGDQNILTVEISTDGGTNWMQIVAYTNDISHWVDEFITLDNFALTATTQIRFIGTNHWGYAIGLDDIVVEPHGSCLYASGLSADNITAGSVDLSWRENGSAINWNIEYGLAGFVQGQGTTVSVSANPSYTLTGLNSQTAYEFYVQADCGGGDVSYWTGPFTFYTACDPVDTFPYNYGFEDTTSNTSGDWFGICWSGDPQNTGAGTYAPPFRWTPCNVSYYSSTGPARAHSGAMFAYTVPYGYNSGDVAQLKSPVLDLSSLSQPQLSFYYHMYGVEMGTLSLDIFDGTTWINNIWSLSGQQQTSSTDPWRLAQISLSNTVTQIRFRGIRGNGIRGNMAIDDITIQETPSCQSPTHLNVSNITSDSVDLSWLRNGSNIWDIEYGAVGFTNGSGTLINGVTSNSYTVSGLASDTFYDFYVRADCDSSSGNDTTIWMGPITLRTLCGVVSTFPHNYGFEHTTRNSGGDWSGTCWSGNPENTGAGYTSGPYRWTPNRLNTYSTYTGPSSAHNGTMYAYTEASGSNTGDVAELISPVLDLSSLTQPQLTFYYHMHGSDMGSLSLDTYDGVTWINDVWTLSGEQQPSSSDPWLEANVFFSNNVTQVRFRAIHGNGYQNDMAIDDITIQEMSYCQPPTGLSVSSVSDDSVNLSWTANGPATVWNIEYGPTGFTQGQGVTINTTSNPYTLTGLTLNTTYDYYVQSDCGSSGFSTWTGPYTFSVYCSSTHTLPYIKDFDTSVGCWTVEDANTDGFIWELMSANGTTTSCLSGAGDSVMSVHVNPNQAMDDWLFSPGFNLSTNTSYTIRFSYGNNASITEVEDMDVYLTTGANATDAISGIQFFSETGISGGCHNFSNTTITVPVDDIYYVAFHGKSPTNQGVLMIDDFSISETPYCAPPLSIYSTNITDNSAELYWTVNGIATAWDIEYGPAGFTQGQGTTDSVSTQTYTITGLNFDTSYDFYIQSDCGGGNTSSWVGPYRFSTTCPIYTSPYVESFESGDLVCWTNETYNDQLDWRIRTGPTDSSGTGPDNAHSGNYYIYVKSSFSTHDDTAIIYSPKVDLSSFTTPRLNFFYHMFGQGMNPDGSIDVGISTNGFTFTNIFHVQGNQGNQWYQGIVDLSAYSGIVSFRITGTIGAGASYLNDFAIDDFIVEESSGCPEPTNLYVQHISDSQAQVSWLNGSNETAWNIEYGSTGFTQGQGTLISTSTNSYTISGLTSNSSYDFYVQADCGGGITSTWSGPYTFTTLCSIYSTPFTEGFEDGELSCWINKTNDQLDWTVNSGPTASINTGPDAAHSGTYYIYIDSSSGIRYYSATIYSPDFDLSPLMSPELNFYYHMYGDGMTPDGSIDIAISTDGGITFTNIFHEQGNHGNQWQHGVVNISAYSGVVSFKITGTLSATGLPYQNDFAIDDFSVMESTGIINKLSNISAIYPNPTTGEFIIKSHDLDDADVFVYTITGKEIYHDMIDRDTYTVNLKGVNKGVYFVKIVSDDKSYVSKLVIK